MSQALWRNLLDDLKEKIEISKHEKSNRDKKQQLIDALDRVFDEIKSGEYNAASDDTLKKHSKELFRLFKTILSNFDDWTFKQTISFALVHFYFTFEKQALSELILSDDEETNILKNLLHNITDSKREVRDATAQSLGGLSKVIGVDFLDRDMLLDILQNPKKRQPEEPYKAVEGLMNTLGYILRNCPHMSMEQYDFMVDLLMENSRDERRFESYSSYVRRYAVRSLAKALQSPIIHKVRSEKLNEFHKVILERFNDQDIDVRKANAQVFINYLITIINGAADKTQVVSDVTDELISLLDHSEIKWQQRHGICLAFESMSVNVQVLKLIKSTPNVVEKIFQALKKQVIKKEQEKTASNANAIAGKSMTNYFINLYLLDRTPSHLEEVRQLVVTMLTSDDPLLLDAGNYSVIHLLSRALDVIQPFLNDLLSLVYKNTFHASYPIKSGALLSLNRAVERMNLSSVEELITALTANVVSVLIAESKSTNYEVRESIFKAFEDLMTRTKSMEPTTADMSKRLFEVLRFGATDRSCGSNSDYPRSAAINALSSYLAYLARNGSISNYDAELVTIVKLLNELINEEEMVIVISSLKLARAVDLFYKHIDISSLYGAIMILSFHNDDEIKFTCLPLRTSVIGPVTSEKLSKIVQSLHDDIFNEDVEEEKREAASYVLRFLASHEKLLKQAKMDLGKVLLLVGKALLLEENRESKVIQANALLFMRAMSGSVDLKAVCSSLILRTIFQMLLNVLAGKKTVEFDETIFEEEDDEEEEEEDEEVGITYPSKTSSSKLNGQVGKLVCDIVMNLLPLEMEGVDSKEAVDCIKNLLTLYKANKDNQHVVSLIANTMQQQHYETMKDLQGMAESENSENVKGMCASVWENIEDIEIPTEREDDDEVKLYSIESASDGYTLGRVTDGVVSPFYIENIVSHALAMESVTEEHVDAVVDLLQTAIEDEDDESIGKYCFILFNYLSHSKKEEGADIEDKLNEMAQTLLSKAVANELEENTLAWIWRVLECIVNCLGGDSTELLERIVSSFEESKTAIKTNSKVFVLACSCCLQAAILLGKDVLEQVKLVVSDMINDEDVDEGKMAIQTVLHRNQVTLPFPTPKVDSVKSNETFAATQSK